MALLTVQTIATTGLAATFAAAATAGDTFLNNGRTFFYVKNANVTTARTVTINSLVPCNQGSDHDLVVSVAASTNMMIGPFEQSRFNSSAGVVSATYSAETDLTVAAISL